MIDTPAAASPPHIAPNAPLAPCFVVLHGNRLEDLRARLTAHLQQAPLPPLTPEVILVQSNGMKHWLELGLADDAGLGICAATQLALPSAYLWKIYQDVLGYRAAPSYKPFDKGNLLWRLQRLLPLWAASKPVYAPLKRYLEAGTGMGADADAGEGTGAGAGAGTSGRRLYQLAQQIADVFDGYQNYRPDWLADWADGRDVLRRPSGQAPALNLNPALESAHAWQAQLWRDVRADVGEAWANASPAQVHGRFLYAMQQAAAEYRATGQRPAKLPPRIVVFGVSALPLQAVEALAALGQVCQVLVLVHKPSRYGGRETLDAAPPQPPLAEHPLLASWGQQGRDYLRLLARVNTGPAPQASAPLLRGDVFADPAAGQASPSQLHQLQAAILNAQALPDTPQALGADHSITLVTTHSAQREVEVLHDRLLAWFDADPALMPREVAVLVPDMAAFAPHIQAVFGRFAPGQPRHIPYAVADITPRQSPLVLALEQLLTLPHSRVSLADWFALFEVPAVRQRFGVSEADVAQLQNWLTLAGVRWGLDAQHRMAWGVPAGVVGLDQNTWAFGLRRLLLGYAVGAGAPWGNTLPQAALSSLDAPLLGALLDWVEAINETLLALTGDKTPAQWGLVFDALMARFFEASDDAEDRLMQRCIAPLEPWQKACDAAQLDTPLALDVVRAHWLSQIDEAGLAQRFFGGGVQFAALMPMRALPFKVIALLGMNDGDYPRQKAARDFDLLAQDERPGDRSRREDDRYLFLETILSARQQLYISWQGHRATDNSAQPPSVLVAQLMEHLHRGWTPARRPEKQPLQAFSESYFLQDSPFETYDQDWAQVHTPQATPTPATPEAPEAPEAGDAPPAPAPTSVTLAELRRLLRQPVAVFFQSRLRVWFDEVQELLPVEEPFSLNGLEQYLAGQDLLNGGERAQALEQLALSGRLPMAAFGSCLAAELQAKAQVVRERQAPWLSRYPHALPTQSIDLTMSGITVTGVLEKLWAGDAGWLQRQQRVGAVLEGDKEAQTGRCHVVTGLWVNHLVACASGHPLTSVQLGLDGQVVFNPLAPDAARSLLQHLLKGYLAAWTRPLPVACKTAWAYLQAQAKGERMALNQPDKEPPDPHELAKTAFEGSPQRAGERSESPYLSRAFADYDALELELPGWAALLYGGMAQHMALTPLAGAPA